MEPIRQLFEAGMSDGWNLYWRAAGMATGFGLGFIVMASPAIFLIVCGLLTKMIKLFTAYLSQLERS